MSEEKIAIWCKNKEEWAAVRSKHGFNTVKKFSNGGPNPCWEISPDRGDFSRKDYYVDEGYTIIPASEYLKDGELKVGDRVRVVSKERFKGSPYFNSDMDELLGSQDERVISSLSRVDDVTRCTLRGCSWVFDIRWLEKVNQPKTTKKGASKMAEIKTNFMEAFPKDTKLAVKMSARFGDQYSNTDRDKLALERDKGDLVKILKDEEDAEKAEEEKAAKQRKSL
jgi:hypothetical protein